MHYYRLYFAIEDLKRKGFMNIIMFVIFAAHNLASTLRSAQDELYACDKPTAVLHLINKRIHFVSCCLISDVCINQK